MGEGVLKHYAPYLPISAATPALSIGEGDTPLVRSRRIGDELGVGALYFKLEGCNPTGSFKDRGMVVAVAKAMEDGATTLLCASTGNTSAAAAAYGAVAGMEPWCWCLRATSPRASSPRPSPTARASWPSPVPSMPPSPSAHLAEREPIAWSTP